MKSQMQNSSLFPCADSWLYLHVYFFLLFLSLVGKTQISLFLIKIMILELKIEEMKIIWNVHNGLSCSQTLQCLCICSGRPNQAPHYPAGLKSTSSAKFDFDVSNLSGESKMCGRVRVRPEILFTFWSNRIRHVSSNQVAQMQ